jgi:TolA-binding protein
MSGDGSNDATMAQSVQFATWLLAVCGTLSALGIAGVLTFVVATNKQITKIETRQEDFLNRVAITMEENKSQTAKLEKLQVDIQNLNRKVDSTREVLRFTGYAKYMGQ